MNNPDHLRFSPSQPIVLLAEDEVMIRNVARVTLEKAGYGVLTADDGEEALELSRVFPGVIHLLLTDVIMPRMSGLDLARHLGTERPDTRILIMSGTDHPGGYTEFLQKPFTPATLRTVVARMLSDGPPIAR